MRWERREKKLWKNSHWQVNAVFQLCLSTFMDKTGERLAFFSYKTTHGSTSKEPLRMRC
jgi:hypothetical protein